MSELKYIYELIDDGAGEFETYSYYCACSNIEPDPDDGTPHLCGQFHSFWDPRFQPQHRHIQCTDCLQTYCFDQLCVPPPTVGGLDNG